MKLLLSLLALSLLGFSSPAFGNATVGTPGTATDLPVNSIAVPNAAIGLLTGGTTGSPACFNGKVTNVTGTTPGTIVTLPSNQASVFAFVTGFLSGTGTFYDVIAETGGASPTVISTFTSSAPTRAYTYSGHTLIVTLGSGTLTWVVSAGYISTQ